MRTLAEYELPVPSQDRLNYLSNMSQIYYSYTTLHSNPSCSKKYCNTETKERN